MNKVQIQIYITNNCKNCIRYFWDENDCTRHVCYDHNGSRSLNASCINSCLTLGKYYECSSKSNTRSKVV